jgi:hypothetical protein
MRVEPAVDMRVRLRKAHPCGSDVFRVIATGADVRLVCEGCGRKIFVERARFAGRVKEALGARTE